MGVVIAIDPFQVVYSDPPTASVSTPLRGLSICRHFYQFCINVTLSLIICLVRSLGGCREIVSNIIEFFYQYILS